MFIMKKFISIMLLSIIFSIILISFSPEVICEESTENIFYVSHSGAMNHAKTIQEAIDNSSDGDNVFVYSGTYNETIFINKSISLIGEDKETTIINLKDDNFVKLNSPEIIVTGFTIQDGSLSGIEIVSSVNSSIYQNIIHNNSIGINILVSSNLKIYNNTISNNANTGINIVESIGMTPTTNCLFYHNNFINNPKAAYDGGQNNTWSFNKEGNYWDNYSGLDKDNNGIGDTAYSSESGTIVDDYPLMMPYIGVLRIKEYYVNEGPLYQMLIYGIIAASIFCIPIGYIWYRMYYKKKK